MTTVDTETFTIRFHRTLRASPAAVFDAWTRPERIAQWWDPTGAKLQQCTIDLRPGGAFSFVNAGHSPPFTGVYREVEPTSKLVFDAIGAIGTVLLSADGENTEMNVTIRCQSGEHLAQFLQLGVKDNTDLTFDNLARYVS